MMLTLPVASTMSKNLPIPFRRGAPAELFPRQNAADDICGKSTGQDVASETRNKDTWAKYKMDDWLIFR